jgi:hypothetical protein
MSSARGIGDRLRVIARRVGNHAARPLLRGQRKQRVERAAQLERPDRLQALRFQPQSGSRKLDERRPKDETGDPLARGFDLGQSDKALGHGRSTRRKQSEGLTSKIFARLRRHRPRPAPAYRTRASSYGVC